MIRFAKSFTLAVGLLAGGLAAGGIATAQTAATGQFGQRTSSGAYVPSTNDPGCAGLLCSPLPSANAAGGPARNPSEVALPPPCEGLLCSVTPYSMQRPYTAAEAAEIERQRAAAQAQAAAAPRETAAPVRHMRKRRRVAKAAPMKAAPIHAASMHTAPARAAAAKAAPAPAPAATARTPAPVDDVQSLK